MDVLGIHLVGIDVATGKKVLLTLAAIAIVIAVRYAILGAVKVVARRHDATRALFWTRHVTSLAALALIVLTVVSIWFREPAHAAMPVGLVTAGLAVALQKVWTAFAGYLILMRGKLYSVGDRILIGGVRGDVLSVGFLYTRIMEMGQPPPVQSDTDSPAIWVNARQYTGRIVTVTNDKIFDEPVYNYTREFPYLFEEIRLPVKFDADRDLAERILLEVAAAETREIAELGEEARQKLHDEYLVDLDAFTPKVYYRLTDNWLELTLRFVTRDHGVREVKDRMSRAILKRIQEAGIEIASGTYEIVGMPPLRLELAQPPSSKRAPDSQQRAAH